MSYSVDHHLLLGFAMPETLLHDFTEVRHVSCDHVDDIGDVLFCPRCGKQVFSRIEIRASTKPEVAVVLGPGADNFDPGWSAKDGLPCGESLWLGRLPRGSGGVEIRVMGFQLLSGEVPALFYVGIELAFMGRSGVSGDDGESRTHLRLPLPLDMPGPQELGSFLTDNRIPHDPESFGLHLVMETM